MNENNNDGRFKFRLSSTDKSEIPDVETLFRDLKNRDSKIQHLWSHQADILRAYQQSNNHKDIALELPTGTGKTLVGLLIAEWRKRELAKRESYLFQTRQLAFKVGKRAIKKVMEPQELVGPKSQFKPSHFAD